MYDAFHLDGGTGWTRSFLSFPSAQDERALKLEMLVADAVDPNADTRLAIDNIEMLAGGSIASPTNPHFEAQLSRRNTEGNVGVYTTLGDLFVGGPEPGTGPTDGKLYALMSTAGRVPELSSVCLLGLACAAIVALARRS